jgi:hypothetical protein
MKKLEYSIAALLCFLSACTRTEKVTSVRAYSYPEYKNSYGVSPVDLFGAREILHEVAKSPDGWDKWWRFDLSPSDFTAVVQGVSNQFNGPDVIVFENNAILPSGWTAEAEFPGWWFHTPLGDDLSSIHWCYEAGAAERHHGWYFVYDIKAGRAWCWHWNHQWSSSECASGAGV